jgi:methionyl-tRNA formyltransferase
MRLVVCGTPYFAVPTLQHLLLDKHFEIAAVFCQPDRPGARGKVAFSAMKEAALKAGLPLHQPEKIRSPEAEKILRDLNLDAIVIIAYGQIIPGRMLDIPKLGWINLHASLLPKYRGAAPIQWAIANGETKTGLTTMRIDAGMDTGGIVLQREVEIGPAEIAQELSPRLGQLGAPLMAETLLGLASGKLQPVPQDNSKATLAPMLKREDGKIDWSRTAKEIFNRMRGFTPWPGIYTTFRGQHCQIVGLPKFGERDASPPGTLLWKRPELLVACGEGTLFGVTSVRIEGRKMVSAQEFVNGARIAAAERFGEV